jgi:hypothetical protein
MNSLEKQGMKETQRETYSGPATLAIPNIAPTRLVYMGRFSSGTLWQMIKIEPENKPAAPRPATARPQMRPTELGVMAQTREPSSNMERAIR